MDLINDAGIKVILDIAIRPASILLHHKYPSIDIVDANGDIQYPNHRYMDDVGDPMYQNMKCDMLIQLSSCVVGYDDTKQAFKFINSWNTG